MAYEYDRFEREDGGGSFLMGLLAGTVLGAGLGMLFAPKAGTDLRSQLSEQAGKLRTTANDTLQQASGKVSETVQQASGKVTETIQQASGKVTEMVDRGKEAYERARNSVNDMPPGSTDVPPSTEPGSFGTSSYSTPGSGNRS